MLLQPRLNVKLSQRQVLTPGLVQMVSVLALNKLELKDMINGEMIENPVLEEVEDFSESLDEIAGQEGDRERSAEDLTATASASEKDPFDEIDFGSYFQDYLDPGYRTASHFEEYDKPSFENFLAQPSTLSDYLGWQLGSMALRDDVRAAAELIIGNLNEDGYLTASDDELADALFGAVLPPPDAADEQVTSASVDTAAASSAVAATAPSTNPSGSRHRHLALIAQARAVISQLDPVGVGARDLRECLLLQLAALRRDTWRQLQHQPASPAAPATAEFAAADPPASEGDGFASASASDPEAASSAASPAEQAPPPVDFDTAELIVAEHLALLQKKDMRELTRVSHCSAAQAAAAVDLIRSLDPRPGQRYNNTATRLIEPDVAFVKRDDVYVVVMNEEDMPALRLNQGYRRMLREKSTEREVKEYVKERYKAAIQLLRNIDQRKNTIVRVCESIVRRQHDFLERGVDSLHPMMIKEVAEEIGVHPSTVSRAVANKYVHTTQGVYELRFFFSEGVNGPEGGDLPLLLLKRRVKKLIEEEDPRHPWTDEYLAAELQRQGIQVTRRTVAKYRDHLQIPSTHQRRVR